MAERTRDSIADVWGGRTPFRGEHQWLERVDAHLDQEPDRWVQSVCPLCSNGCGVDVGVKDGTIVGVRGREVDRVNRGRLGPKGLHGWRANTSRDRLIRPLIREGSKSASDGVQLGASFREASWDEAMDLVARRSREVMARYTGDAIGFYNSGQLFTEEYYTLSLIANAGVRTRQLDSNTRLCTATTGFARWETFGAAVNLGSYADIDATDCIFMVGHNVANTQTVLWMRILDRLEGPDPPTLIVVDPRRTHTARRADVHLAPRLGTNVALMNGLLHLIIRDGRVDREFLERHTVGFERLAEKVRTYTPERVSAITAVPIARLEEAAEILGTTPTLVSTCLQGVYQSNQATAAAVQVNNLNLVRGLVGRPGCTILQMNGQPSAQNTHETGADGDYAGMRNWQNPRHMEELARIWNVELSAIPHWGEKHHAMEIFRHAEHGSLRMLWIVATNPAVSLPELPRIRRILAREELFVVVSDAFMTETAQLADVVLPAAVWGEKTGTMTNVDRTVHISHQAVDPPGEARSDLDIFLDYARRMDFRDRDGGPLVTWSTPEEAFEAWKACSRGRPCDYSGMSYAKLSASSGIQYPCNEEHPDGTERLGTDLTFPTAAAECQSYGHDIETGAVVTKEEYEANDPKGRAILKAADYHPPVEEPDEAYPFWLTTHRVVYQFQTRTKTGRSQALHDAAPEAYVQLDARDAERLEVGAGELVEVRTRRGSLRAPARIGDVSPGTVSIPYHYGYWDARDGRHRAADELTISAWDPVSKQPYFKFAAAQVVKVEEPSLTERVTDLAGKTVHRAKEAVEKVSSSIPPERVHVPDYLGLLGAANEEFAEACRTVRARAAGVLELQMGLEHMEELSAEAAGVLQPFVDRYGARAPDAPSELREALVPALRPGAFGILRDLHALLVLTADVRTSRMVVEQAARQLGDAAFVEACGQLQELTHRQKAWLKTKVKHLAPHTLVVPQ